MSAPTMPVNAIEMLAARAITAGASDTNVPSPCISVCRMDAHNVLCTGCLRSLDEIRLWSTNTDLEKKAIWLQIGRRLQTLTAGTP
jgi:predicted Fe-S protein YdhL (DUF1289 family)